MAPDTHTITQFCFIHRIFPLHEIMIKKIILSTMDIKTRLSKHRTDIRKKTEFCGLTKHFHHHQGDWEVAKTRLVFTLLDHVECTYSAECHLQLKKDRILNLGTWGPSGFNSRNELLTNQRRGPPVKNLIPPFRNL